MAIAQGKAWLKEKGFGDRVLEFEGSTATVELAAQQLGTEPARIAKTLTFRNKAGDGCLILVAAGDARIDNKKFRETFGVKARMCTPEEALTYTGHAVGGVCPFGIPETVPVYLDASLKRFDIVYPAAGNDHSAVRLTPDELYIASGACGWADVGKLPEE